MQARLSQAGVADHRWHLHCARLAYPRCVSLKPQAPQDSTHLTRPPDSLCTTMRAVLQASRATSAFAKARGLQHLASRRPLIVRSERERQQQGETAAPAPPTPAVRVPPQQRREPPLPSAADVQVCRAGLLHGGWRRRKTEMQLMWELGETARTVLPSTH